MKYDITDIDQLWMCEDCIFDIYILSAAYIVQTNS